MSSFLPIPNTEIKKAFDFDSSIKPEQLLSRYSKTCIFCSSNESVSLMQDGSFRRCLWCKKNFKANILHEKKNENAQAVSYKTPLFPTIRPNFMPPNKN